jgi:two-component system phosphate regulon response regulator PhoB
MSKEKILVIEDEEDILELLEYNLRKEGYAVTCVTSGEEGLERAASGTPDLILLDLMLPGMDGLEVCRRLKSGPAARNTPIVMITAKSEESDIVSGLELGADDYVTKPFSPRVVIARVRAVLRRRSLPFDDQEAALCFEDLEIHPGRHEVLAQGEPVELTFTEFRILHLLARRPGWVFSRYSIVDAVRGDDHAVSDRSVDVQIVGLRKKLGPCGAHIETVRGVGYRFRD